MADGNHIDALAQAHALRSKQATSAEFKAGIEQALSVVRACDEANANAPKRRAEILAKVDVLLSRTITDLIAHEATEQSTTRLRAIASAIASDLEARLPEAEKAEAARDEARKPFEALTRRANDYALRAAEGPKLFQQIFGLFSADIEIAKVGRILWSRIPPPKGTYISYQRNLDGMIERVIATPATLAAVRLPGFSSRDFGELERTVHFDDEDREAFGPVIAQALGELRELIRNHDQRRIVITDENAARAVARAQAVLIAEYNKTCAAIRQLLAMDAQIPAADLGARYPDGVFVFRDAMFPKDWRVGAMNKDFNGRPYVALPSIDGFARVAE